MLTVLSIAGGIVSGISFILFLIELANIKREGVSFYNILSVMAMLCFALFGMAPMMLSWGYPEAALVVSCICGPIGFPFVVSRLMFRWF